MNKKGAALILVLIIGVVLASFGALMFTMANSSISSADTGIKGREAHANAKSGYDLIRSLVPKAFDIAKEERDIEFLVKENNPDYYPDPTPKRTEYFGYLNEEGTFVLGEHITEKTPAFEKARIQINFKFERTIGFIETNGETKAGIFHLDMTVSGWSRGKSNEVSKFTEVLEKGMTLNFMTSDSSRKNYHGIDIEIDNIVIPGTNVEAKHEVGEGEEDFKLNSDKPIKWDTFYYEDEYYIYLGPPPNISTLSAENFKKEKHGIIKLLIPPDYPKNPLMTEVMDLSGWDGEIGGYGNVKKSLDAFLQNKYPGFNKSLEKGAVIQYNGMYYVFLDEPHFQLPPGDNGEGHKPDWVSLDKNL